MSSQVLQEIQNSTHWDEQVALLQSLPITQQTALTFNSAKTNPRSKVLTSTCCFLIQMSEKYGPLLSPFFIGLMGTDVLFKLLNSANKVIFMEIHELFKAIVMHCPHVKYCNILMTELNSKNCQVRQCITSYLVVLADNVQLPGNCLPIIRNYRTDASKVVRENVCKLEQALALKQKQQKIRSNKENQPVIQEKKQKIQQIQNSQVIVESFLKSSQTSQFCSKISSSIDLGQNIEFLISKIHADETWNMKIFAIEQICRIFQSQVLEETLYLKIIQVLVDLLDQKRSKLHKIMCIFLKKSLIEQGQIMRKYLENNFTHFIEKTVKNQQGGSELISLSIGLDPPKFILQLAQCTIDAKAFKQKVILLDLLATKLCFYPMPSSKMPTIIKMTCKLIDKYHNHKQIYLPCLAILSHFKVSYNSEFLGWLLCQEKTVLTKIIEIAEKIDPQLREAIIEYIHSLKGQKKETKQHANTEIHGPKSNQLQKLLEEVVNQKENSVARLVEYVFQKKGTVSVREFYEIIKLTEKVTTKDSLLELQLLLQQICKSQSQNFVQALFQVIASCNGNTIQSEYIVSYLRKINTAFASSPWLMHLRHSQNLISIYRYSKCPKIRLLCIKTLSLFPAELTASHLNLKQKKLIENHQKYESQTVPPL